MKKADLELVSTHTLSVGFVRTPGPRMECKMACTTCKHVVFVYVWEDDYVSVDGARERAVDSGKRSFRYDCANYLAQSVMEG